MWQTAVALVFAHVIADFALQTRFMVQAKHRPAVFAAHVAIVGLTSVIALGAATLATLFACALLALAHGAIDAIKAGLSRRVLAATPETGALWLFCVDQAAHLITIAVFVAVLPWAYNAGSWPLVFDADTAMRLCVGMALAAGIIVAVRVGDLLLILLLDAVRGRAPASEPTAMVRDATDRARTLRAGAWIGRLERGLVFLLVMAGQFSAIGFVIAAKSILRFEYARDPEQGEQVIVGTLASFGWAIGTALATRAAITALLG